MIPGFGGTAEAVPFQNGSEFRALRPAEAVPFQSAFSSAPFKAVDDLAYAETA